MQYTRLFDDAKLKLRSNAIIKEWIMFDFLTLIWVIIVIAVHIKCTKIKIIWCLSVFNDTV
jgi:hypothetical protein